MKTWVNNILSDFYHKYLDDVVGIGSGALTSWFALHIHFPNISGILEAVVKGVGIFMGGFLGWLGKELAVFVAKKITGKTTE